MFEEILKEFLGTTKTFDDLFNEVFDNKVNTDDVSNKRNHSYFHSVKDKYKNGENVCHSEKEIKDGKVIKDVNYVNYSVNTDDKKHCKCNDYCALKVTSQFWEDSFRSAEYTLIERDKKIAELERKLAKVTKDKEYLLNKFEQVKNIFSK